MRLKRNLSYLLMAEIFLYIMVVVRVILVQLKVISPQEGYILTFWSSLAMVFPVVIVLSRLTMFSKKFYTLLLILAVHIVGLVASRVLPGDTSILDKICDVISTMIPYGLMYGIFDLLGEQKEKEMKELLKKFHPIATAVYGFFFITTIYRIVKHPGSDSAPHIVFLISAVLISIFWIISLALFAYVVKHMKNDAQLYRTLNVAELNSIHDEIALKTKVTDSVTKNFLCSVAVNLLDESFCIVSADESLKDSLSNVKSIRAGYESMAEQFVADDYKDVFIRFTDVRTIRNRLQKKNIITVEFTGEKGGKCRAAFLPLSFDQDGNLIEVLFTVQHISGEILALRNQLATKETLNRCIEALHKNGEFGSAVDDMLACLGEYYDADRAYIFMLNDAERIMNNTSEWCKAGVAPEQDNLQGVSFDEWTHWLDALKADGEYRISNLGDERDSQSYETKFLEQQGIDSLYAVALQNGSKNLIGFLGIDNPRQRVDEEVLIKSVATFMAMEIEEEHDKEMLYKLSRRDGLTNCLNRNAYHEKIGALQNAKAKNFGIVFADVNGLKKTNDSRGHEAGDRLLLDSADLLQVFFGKENLYRIGGDEFVVICENITKEGFFRKIENCKNGMEEPKIFSIGEKWVDDLADANIERIIAETDMLMYERKQMYYKDLEK